MLAEMGLAKLPVHRIPGNGLARKYRKIKNYY